MKNKNGFTLVELLGVIVVLAILALITVPIISNVITNARINALRDSAYGLIEASNLYYVSKGNNTTIRFDKNESTDTLKELSYKGVVKQGTVIIDRKGNVTVCITDGKNSAYKNYNETKVTTSKGRICNIKDNSSIVYLDDEATITQYDNAKLTELVNELQNEMKDMKDNFLDKTYPVGSTYISFEDKNPSELFGGTWEQIESGKMLQSTSTTSGQTGGQSTYSYTPEGTVGDTTLTDQQMPSHSHTGNTLNITGRFRANQNNSGHTTVDTPSGVFYSESIDAGSGKPLFEKGNFTVPSYNVWINLSTSGKWSGETSIAGNSQPHTHSFTGTQEDIKTVPPYITVYMYKRTA